MNKSALYRERHNYLRIYARELPWGTEVGTNQVISVMTEITGSSPALIRKRLGSLSRAYVHLRGGMVVKLSVHISKRFVVAACLRRRQFSSNRAVIF